MFVPESDAVEEFHEFLAQGRINLAEYAGKVAEETSRRYGRTDKVMTLYFDQADHNSAVVRSVVVYSSDDCSDIDGYDDLGNDYGRLAGVAPEALDAFDNQGSKAPTTRQLAQRAWDHLSTVDVKKGFTRKSLEDALCGRP